VRWFEALTEGAGLLFGTGCGKNIAMKTAIDGFGRVVIPRPLRDRAALTAGTELDARYEDGRIVLEPAPLSIRIRKKGLFFVAEALAPMPPLSSAYVERELETLRAGREINERERPAPVRERRKVRGRSARGRRKR
jgi:AbrB family looped-hinge helix DNA binding protein